MKIIKIKWKHFFHFSFSVSHRDRGMKLRGRAAIVNGFQIVKSFSQIINGDAWNIWVGSSSDDVTRNFWNYKFVLRKTCKHQFLPTPNEHSRNLRLKSPRFQMFLVYVLCLHSVCNAATCFHYLYLAYGGVVMKNKNSLRIINNDSINS